jgi:predicted HAD superfamily phosphohydrolase YqeG
MEYEEDFEKIKKVVLSSRIVVVGDLMHDDVMTDERLQQHDSMMTIEVLSVV